jgi:hypothetical protein
VHRMLRHLFVIEMVDSIYEEVNMTLTIHSVEGGD